MGWFSGFAKRAQRRKELEIEATETNSLDVLEKICQDSEATEGTRDIAGQRINLLAVEKAKADPSLVNVSSILKRRLSTSTHYALVEQAKESINGIQTFQCWVEEANKLKEKGLLSRGQSFVDDFLAKGIDLAESREELWNIWNQYLHNHNEKDGRVARYTWNQYYYDGGLYKGCLSKIKKLSVVIDDYLMIADAWGEWYESERSEVIALAVKISLKEECAKIMRKYGIKETGNIIVVRLFEILGFKKEDYMNPEDEEVDDDDEEEEENNED